jgi:cell division protein FtsB
LKLRYVLGGIFLAGAAYFALFGGEYGMLELREIRAERAREEQRLEEVRAEVVRLEATVDSLQHDSARIERLARERWGLIKPGERLYRFAHPDTGGNPVPHADSVRRE